MIEWQKVKLGDVCDLIAGFAFKSSDFGSYPDKVIKITNIEPPFVNTDSLRGVDLNSYNKIKLEKYIAKKGDYVLAMTGATIGKLGRIYKSEAYINQRVLMFKNKSLIDKRFLYYVLADYNFLNYITNHIDSESAQANISASTIGKYIFPIPPLEIQRKIAGILGALDDKIEVLRKQNKTLEQMAQAVFQSWFVDFDIVRAKAAGIPTADICKKYHITPDICALFPSAFTPDNLPLGWEKKKLGEEFKITMGQSPAGDTYNEEKKGIPFFQGRRDFGFRYPTDRVYCTAPTRFAEKGDVLVSVRAPVGDLNIAKTECCIGRGVASVRHYTGDTAYTFYHLKNLSNDFEVFNGNGTVFGCIGKDDFLNLSFISCPQKTLEKLLPFFDAFENKIYENSKQIRTLEQTRDALLPQLLGGKIEV